METINLEALNLRKIFIQRDFTKGTKIKFETTFPNELNGLVTQESYVQFMESLNEIYNDSERLTICESCLACLTAYLLYLCIETYKEKCMKKALELIDKQNEIWRDRGVVVLDPISRGYRVMEIQIYTNNQTRPLQ